MRYRAPRPLARCEGASHVRDLFDGATGRADQTARIVPEVVNLEDQLAAARER